MSRLNNPTGKRAIYYFPEWGIYARNFQVKDIPADVTDIAYAFFNLDSNGRVFSGDPWATTDKRFTDNSVPPADSWNDTNPNAYYGTFGQFKKLKDSGRQFNMQLSIGGWTWSKYFSDAVSTPATRTTFTNSLIETFKKYPIFNGVSLDWEYLSNNGVNVGNEGNTARKEDPENFRLFLQQLRSALNSNGMSHYIISFCCIAAPEKALFNARDIDPFIDEWHIMTYDFHSSSWGETKTAHHTNPRKSSFGSWSAEEAADHYLSQGVPSTKLYIGGAFYSRGFANTTGLGQPGSGMVPQKSWEDGVIDYKQLPMPGATEYLDPESKGAYSYDPTLRIVNTYDNPDSMKEKCRIVFEKNLGGIIIWEISGNNFADPSRDLVKLLKNNLTHGFVEGVNQPPVQPPVVQPPVQPPVVQPPVVQPPVVQPPVQPPVVQPPVVQPPVVSGVLFDGVVKYMGGMYRATITVINGENVLTLVPLQSENPNPTGKVNISFDFDLSSLVISNALVKKI